MSNAFASGSNAWDAGYLRVRKDAVDAAREKPGEASLAHRERQAAKIVAVTDQAIEGVELDFMVVPA